MPTTFLDSHYALIPRHQREWHIQTQNFQLQHCKKCSNIVNWSIKNKKYSTYCSSKCAQSDRDVRLKIEKTCIERFGATSNLKTDENKEKQKATCLAKYGVENYSKTDSFKENFKVVCAERYGVSNPSKLRSVQEKIDQTHLERYGRKRSSQVHIPIDIVHLKNDPVEMSRLFNDLKMPISEIAELLGVSHSQLCVQFKENLNIDITRHMISKCEREVFNYVKQLVGDAEQSNRMIIKPKELDIVVPSHNLAIEVDGLAWHTELRGKDKLYHINKTTLCNANNFRLLHILDYEWNTMQEVVKSRLSGILRHNTRVYARHCSIVTLTPAQATEFFNRTHIQKTCSHKIAYGLKSRTGELVAAMSFGKSRFNKGVAWELLRFSNQLFINVIGGASKLFAHFIRTHSPESVISYCDLRWNTGTVYEKLGFVKTATSSPNYWYTSRYQTFENRMNYQKHKLKDKLSQFDPRLTEWENMAAAGYDRLWDCGNSVFVWRP
jgi:hypothetical protein